MPDPKFLPIEGWLNEHDTPLPPPSTEALVSMHGLAGVFYDPQAHEPLVTLELGLNSALNPSVIESAHFNLCVVVDRSGSMAEDDKLEHVKAGLMLLLDQLDEADRLAIVTYDDEAHVLVPSQPVTDDQGIVEASAPYNAQGIGITTVGVGTSFNFNLMYLLANQGGGNFYFVDTLQKLVEVFVEELKYLLTPVAENLPALQGTTFARVFYSYSIAKTGEEESFATEVPVTGFTFHDDGVGFEFFSDDIIRRNQCILRLGLVMKAACADWHSGGSHELLLDDLEQLVHAAFFCQAVLESLELKEWAGDYLAPLEKDLELLDRLRSNLNGLVAPAAEPAQDVPPVDQPEVVEFGFCG